MSLELRPFSGEPEPGWNNKAQCSMGHMVPWGPSEEQSTQEVVDETTHFPLKLMRSLGFPKEPLGFHKQGERIETESSLQKSQGSDTKCSLLILLILSTQQFAWSINSVQFSRLVMSNSLQPHRLHHARLLCPSLSPSFAQIHVHWVSDAI